MRSRRASALAILGTLLAPGCGPPPPQAPSSEAVRLAHATGGVAKACGRSYRLGAFHADDRAAHRRLVREARASVTDLAAVARRDPAAVYQGETVSAIAQLSAEMLRSCRLGAAVEPAPSARP
jgi:hypothetical protein